MGRGAGGAAEVQCETKKYYQGLEQIAPFVCVYGKHICASGCMAVIHTWACRLTGSLSVSLSLGVCVREKKQ